MNALADPRVAEYLNENFICTYLKVGTFQIINGQKVGGNVASYFCMADGSVVHAIPGQVKADKLLKEAAWAYETRKSALTLSTDFARGIVDMKKCREQIKKAHTESYFAEQNPWAMNKGPRPLPMNMPRNVSQQAQAHWLLGRSPLAQWTDVYPIVWTQILGERLSTLSVAKN